MPREKAPVDDESRGSGRKSPALMECVPGKVVA